MLCRHKTEIISMSCLVCNRDCVEEFLDLGRTALANKFLTRQEIEAGEEKFPLRVGFCHNCNHVQLTEKVPPEKMFEDYLYISSASDTLQAHFKELSELLVKRFGLSSDNLVVDIGCNDATLLRHFARQGVRTLGVDPAQNLASLSSGVDRFTGYFTSRTASEIVREWGRADVITTTNTFPHIQNLQDFIQGIKLLLAPGGVFVVEAHYLVDLLEQAAFDTVYHEHVSYWALRPLNYLLEAYDLQVVDAERLPIHHGQLRVFIQRKEESWVRPSVGEILDLEKRVGLDRIETFKNFAAQALETKRGLTRLLQELKTGGKRIAGYGAPAKASTLLEFLELGPETVEFIADKSPLKQGRFTPGMHIEIVPPEKLLEERPDFVLLLAWNFEKEILEQQAEYRRLGGRFIVPVPEARVVQ